MKVGTVLAMYAHLTNKEVPREILFIIHWLETKLYNLENSPFFVSQGGEGTIWLVLPGLLI